MKNPLTIIARVRAKRGLENLMISEQAKLVAATIKSPGCLRYELYVSNKDHGLVTFVEQWITREHWNNHMQSDRIESFRNAAGHSIDEFELLEMHQIA